MSNIKCIFLYQLMLLNIWMAMVIIRVGYDRSGPHRQSRTIQIVSFSVVVCNRNGLIEIVMLDIPDKTVN